VRDLPADEREALGDADDGADIYHPLYQPYDELDSDGRSKNAVPMVVLCNAMGDIVLPANSELAALESALEQFIEGSNTQLVGLLARIQHLGFTASEVRVGARGYGEGARDDMGLHGFLSRSVQELDVDALKPVAEWMLTQLREPRTDWRGRSAKSMASAWRKDSAGRSSSQSRTSTSTSSERRRTWNS
jgi:hypothetical protein